MNQYTIHRILDIQEKIRSDPGLMAEHDTMQGMFLNVLQELTEKQRSMILDYLGVCTEIHLRMLALACETEQEK